MWLLLLLIAQCYNAAPFNQNNTENDTNQFCISFCVVLIKRRGIATLFQ